MERMVWAVRAHMVPAPDIEDEGDFPEVTMILEDWEPFGVTEDYVLCKKQVMIEDEKSSVNHPMSFAERFE
jgi:hypothetical protein